jgi:hypothetical protein
MGIARPALAAGAAVAAGFLAMLGLAAVVLQLVGISPAAATALVALAVGGSVELVAESARMVDAQGVLDVTPLGLDLVGTLVAGTLFWWPLRRRVVGHRELAVRLGAAYVSFLLLACSAAALGNGSIEASSLGLPLPPGLVMSFQTDVLSTVLGGSVWFALAVLLCGTTVGRGVLALMALAFVAAVVFALLGRGTAGVLLVAPIVVPLALTIGAGLSWAVTLPDGGQTFSLGSFAASGNAVWIALLVVWLAFVLCSGVLAARRTSRSSVRQGMWLGLVVAGVLGAVVVAAELAARVEVSAFGRELVAISVGLDANPLVAVALGALWGFGAGVFGTLLIQGNPVFSTRRNHERV